MAPELSMLIKVLIGVIIMFSAAGMVFLAFDLWENYWSNKDNVERYKNYIAEHISERKSKENKHE